MRICAVIFPDFILRDQYSNTPDGIFRIFTLMKQGGFNIDLLDLRKTTNMYEFLFEVKRNSFYNTYLLSTVTPQADFINGFCRIVRACNKEAKFVLGGPHVNALMTSKHWEFLEGLKILHPMIDLFVTGCCYIVEDVVKIIRALGNGAEKIHTWSREDKLDLILPMPYEHLNKHSASNTGIMMRNGAEVSLRTQNMLFSVGCAFNCAFCFNYCSKIYRAEPEDIVKELIRRKRQYAIGGIKISDDDPFQDLEWNDRFIKELEEEGLTGLRFLASTRCDVHRSKREPYRKLKQIKELQKFGLSVLGVGVEWGSDRVLKHIDKKTTMLDVYDTIIKLHEETDIEILLYMMFGLPPINEKTIDENIRFLQWCKGKVKHISMTSFTPLPGSPLYENPEKYGVKNFVPYGNEKKFKWSDFYFVGDFDRIRSRSKDLTDEMYLKYKYDTYKVLEECGFLREETKKDME